MPSSDQDEGSLRELEVEGHSFNPNGGKVQGLSGLTPNLEAVAEVFAVCNEARIESKVGDLSKEICAVLKKLFGAYVAFRAVPLPPPESACCNLHAQ